jgi:hypothetical protein
MLIIDVILTCLCLVLAMHNGILTARVKRLKKMLSKTYCKSISEESKPTKKSKTK